ncbi:MAG: hypothetical protein QOC58_2155 [Mycobacterium sp.]|jgi:hypothetical protein|nr:hypothetical protein [Mycobacterium sp.]
MTVSLNSSISPYLDPRYRITDFPQLVDGAVSACEEFVALEKVTTAAIFARRR